MQRNWTCASWLKIILAFFPVCPCSHTTRSTSEASPWAHHTGDSSQRLPMGPYLVDRPWWKHSEESLPKYWLEPRCYHTQWFYMEGAYSFLYLQGIPQWLYRGAGVEWWWWWWWWWCRQMWGDIASYDDAERNGGTLGNIGNTRGCKEMWCYMGIYEDI